MWRFYVDTVATQVGRLRTLIKDLDDKLDEQGAVLCKRKLNDWVFENRKNKQALLHNVDLMLDLTNEEKQRQLGRSVTEWEQFFAQLEASWGFWFPDVKTMLKGPKDETNKTKLRQMISGVSTNASMRCPQTRKLKQSSFNPTERNCSVEVTSEKKSLGQSSRVTDEERRVVGASNPSDVIKSIRDVKVLPEQSNKGSVKATSKNLIAGWMWNRPETFIVDNGWQDFRSGTLLVDTQQILEEETHLVMCEHLVVQTEGTLDYTMTETMKEHRSLAFASNNETSEEMSVQLELLQKSAEVTTVPQDVQQGKLFQVTMFYDSDLLLEKGNK